MLQHTGSAGPAHAESGHEKGELVADEPDEPPSSAAPQPVAGAAAALPPSLTAERGPRRQSPARPFRRLRYPGASARGWEDWLGQLRSRVRALDRREEILDLSAPERAVLRRGGGLPPVAITPLLLVSDTAQIHPYPDSLPAEKEER